MVKKILSTFLASACMLSSVASASGSPFESDEKSPKSPIRDTSPKILKKIKRDKIYLAQKAFLTGLCCALDIDVEIEFIPDGNTINRDFRILSADGITFNYSDWHLSQQSHYLLHILLSTGRLIFIDENSLIVKYFIDSIQIGNHILTSNYICEMSDIILGILHNKKLAAAKEGKMDEIVNLTQDEEFKDEMKDMFSEILSFSPNVITKTHNYYFPPVPNISDYNQLEK